MNFLDARLASETAETVEVEATAFGRISVTRNPYGLQPGADMLIGIRPEQLEISAQQPDASDVMARGHVVNVAFYGENIHYHVGIEGLAEPVIVAVTNYFHKVDHRIGDEVWVGFQNTSVIDLGENREAA